MTLLSPLFSGRALTLKNPWSFAVRFLGKDIENRTRPAPVEMLNVWIALHTGKAPALREDIRGMLDIATGAGWRAIERGLGVIDLYADGRTAVRATPAILAPQSLIPGVFRIVEQHQPYRVPRRCWRVADQWGYHIEYRPFPSPIPCTGPTPKPGKRGSSNLGWWRTPDAVTSRIAGMLAEVCGG